MLDKHWGVRADFCERIVMSDTNALAWVGTPAGPMLAKWSVAPERFPRLAQTARLTSWLDDRGLPVSALIPARDGRLQVEADGVSMGLQRVIAGDLLDAADLTQVRAAGVFLAQLQAALAGYPAADRFPGVARSLTDRVNGWLELRVGQVPAAAQDALREMVGAAPDDRVPRQLVHFDLRSANVLWASAGGGQPAAARGAQSATAGGAQPATAGGAQPATAGGAQPATAAGGQPAAAGGGSGVGGITAILDFEEAQHEHPLVEVARAATLLGTRYHDWGPVPAEVRAEFLDGYRSVRALTPAEAYWLDVLVLWQAMVMVPPGDDPTGWGASALSQLPPA